MSNSKSNPPVVPEPRRGRRTPADRLPSLHANILAGPDVKVIEVAPEGLLLESDVRLTPGAGICLNIALGEQTYLAGGRIARVDATLSGGQVKYRADVTLDNELPAFDLPDESSGEAAPSSPAKAEPEEQPMDVEHQLQILKTALRSSEAARKQLTEEQQAERAEREAERRTLEQNAAEAAKKAAQADQKLNEAARQLNAAKDAERAMAMRLKQEEAAWTKERQELLEQGKEAKALADRASSDLAAAQSGERALAEKHARDQAAWTKERQSLQEKMKELDAHAARAAQASRDLAAARESEQRLTKSVQDQGARLEAALKDSQRFAAEIQTLKAAAAAAEQKLAGHEQERQSWAAQKERLTSRLQLTEQWCADQQELLYSLRQQVGSAFTLLDGWKPSRLEAEAEEDGRAAKPARKATA